MWFIRLIVLTIGIFSAQVDMPRVKLDLIKPWITERVTEMLGMEDEVVIEFVINQLEEKVSASTRLCESSGLNSGSLCRWLQTTGLLLGDSWLSG